MTTDFEEAVSPSHLANPDNIAPDTGNLLFDIGPVFRQFHSAGVSHLRNREPAPVDFAIRGEWNARNQFAVLRHHVVREPLRDESAQLCQVQLFVTNDVSDQPTVVSRPLPDVYRISRNPRILGDARLYFAKLNPETANLDLAVSPPEVFKLSGTVYTRDIACVVKPLAGGERTVDKGRGSQFIIVQVAFADTGTADPQVARYAHWLRSHRRIQYIKLGLVDRRTDMYSLAGIQACTG